MKQVQSVHLHPQPLALLPLAMLAVYIYAQPIRHNDWANYALHDWLRFSAADWGTFTLDKLRQFHIAAQSASTTRPE